MLDVPVWIDHSLREGDAGAVQARDELSVLIDESTTTRIPLGILDGRCGTAVPGESRQVVAGVTHGVDDVGAVREVCLIRDSFPTAGTVDLLDEAAGLGGREVCVLELGARELGGLAFEAGVVAQDPAVGHEFGVAERVSREPFDAQVRMGGTAEVDQVHQGEDGAVRGADDGDGDGFGARDDFIQIARFEHGVEVEPLECWCGAGERDRRCRWG